MLDIITFGSACWDIFLRDEKIYPIKDKRFLNGEGIGFSLGSKIEIDELYLSTGGGGTNAAATFLKQGLKTAYCGGVGSDLLGQEIINDLKRRGGATFLISQKSKKSTNLSIVLSVHEKDRTILTYKGASEDFLLDNFFERGVLSQWFYIAPLSGKSANFFGRLVSFAVKAGIKVAVNLGKDQLNLPKQKLKEILKKTDILILNQEETALLTGLPFSQKDKMIGKIKDFYPGILVMTMGTKGAFVLDKNHLYSVGILKSKVVDRTGAGDSFGSGFVSAIMNGADIKGALQFASANATSCLKEWGAKNGLLEKGAFYKKIKVQKR